MNSLVTLLNGQQNLQTQSLYDAGHEYDNLTCDKPMYGDKNIDLADWLLQIEKVALLANSKEYELASAESTSVPYKC